MWEGELESNELFDHVAAEDRKRERLMTMQLNMEDADSVLENLLVDSNRVEKNEEEEEIKLSRKRKNNKRNDKGRKF